MKTHKILEKQLKNADLSYNIIKEFFLIYPEFENFEYSLLWIAFKKLMNEDFCIKKKNKKLYVKYESFDQKSDYYIVMGKIPKLLLNKFKHLKKCNIKFNNKGFNFITANHILFSPLYKRGDIDIQVNNNEIYKLFKDFLELHYLDIKRFEGIIEKIINKRKPKFILIDEDRTKYKLTIVKIAKKYNVPSFVLQHGITPYKENNKIPLANISFSPIYADYFLAWGNNTKHFLINADNNVNKIIVVGNPFIKKCDIIKSPNSHKILIIDQQFDAQIEERNYVYKKLIDLLKTHNMEFSIYLRHNYNVEYFQKNFSGVSIIKWKKNGILNEIIKYRVIIGFNSSAILESVKCGRPVIIYDYFDRGNEMGFFGNMIKIVNNHNLIQSINELYNKKFSNKDINDTLKEHFINFGESAIENIYKEIMKRI